jgi:transposase
LEALMLFVGDDWAKDHHDVVLVDEDGKRLAYRRFPEGMAGVSGLHALIAAHLPDDWVELAPGEAAHRVKIGIERDHGVWVQALVAAGYEVFAINPFSVANYRSRRSTSGAKSDAADALLLAEIVRLDRAQHRTIAADSDRVEAVKLAARTHQTLIWERSRHVLRLQSALAEFFPAALEAFADLDEPDALELLALAPDPDAAARLSIARIQAALRRARRRNAAERAKTIQQKLRAAQLRQTPIVQSTYAAVVTAQVRLLGALNEQVAALAVVVEQHFGLHPDAEIYASQPGLGVILGARILGEFGDATGRYADAKARKNYAGTSPITRASGKKHIVQARYARNKRIADALQQSAFCSLRGSPGARAYYDALIARNIGHQAALRQLANRHVGILHGCLKTHTPYDENIAWESHNNAAA